MEPGRVVPLSRVKVSGRRAACAAGAMSLAGMLAACASTYPGTTAGQQVHSWATTSPDPKFGAAMTTLQSDLRDVSELEAQAGSSGALKAECDVLVTDALEANQNLPTPDSRLTAVLSSAYSAAVSAGQDCFCATGGHPCRSGESTKGGFLKRSRSESAAARRGFIAAEARVDLLTILSSGGT